MTQHSESTGAEGASPAPSGMETLLPTAADRRRLLLKGVGRGGAILAATVPLKTLASQRLLTSDLAHQCTVSGIQSGVHSASPGSAQVCTGCTPSYFCKSNDGGRSPCNFPPLPNGVTYKTPCSSVFRQSRVNVSLFQVLSTNYASTDEQHWVCAWLNALRKDPSFPYSSDDVMNFYNSSTQYQNALGFFKTYMEKRTS